ncbi:hypothetical protein [Terasakiella sp. SH-1]|uniref:hypothetical protein n=1 Tax=Terasakiella sp. SH-1 TaxID=2560057 RepID=UPI00107408B3|nr:hypothetical protein [Terasakiella sp. SH-1]
MIKHLLQGKAFQTGFIVPSLIWTFVWASYISVYMGWGNFFYLLPHEVAGVLSAFIFPPFLLFVVVVGLSFYQDILQKNKELVEKLALHSKAQSDEFSQLKSDQVKESEALSAMSDLLGKISQSGTANQQALIENGEMHRAFASALNSHHADLGSIEHKLSMLVQLETERDERAKRAQEELENDPLKAITQQTTLLGMFDIILNDTNVSATRLLVNLLDGNGHPKTESLQLVQGLMSAYSVGEKNVFLTVLSQQIAASKNGVKPLADLSVKSELVRADIAKVLKSAQDVENALALCKEGDLTKTAFNDAPLKTLALQLDKEFYADGSAKNGPRTVKSTSSPFKAMS